MIQFTPPGSACSVIFGTNVTAAAPGSAQGLYLIVSDIEAARADLVGRGIEISEVFHDAGDVHAGADEPYLFGQLRVDGPDPIIAATACSPRSAIRTAMAGSFRDHDAAARPHRPMTTTFASVKDLASALRRAAAAHGQHEARTGQADPSWPDWYALHMVREQAGEELPD